MSASGTNKRERDDTPIGIVLFVSIPEQSYFYCYSTSEGTCSEEELALLHMSVPSKRAGRVPGFGRMEDCPRGDGIDHNVWRKVPEEEVVQLRNVTRVVLGFYDE